MLLTDRSDFGRVPLLLTISVTVVCCGCARSSRVITVIQADSTGNEEEIREIRVTSDIAKFRRELGALFEDAFTQLDSRRRSKAVSLTITEPLELPADLREEADVRGVSISTEQTITIGPYWLVELDGERLTYALALGPFREEPDFTAHADSREGVVEVAVNEIQHVLSIFSEGVPNPFKYEGVVE